VRATEQQLPIRAAIKTLRAVGRRCNILNPEDFKNYLAKANYGENRRDKILGDLTRFYKAQKIEFYRPLSRRIETLPFIPLESEIDSLIGGLGPKLSALHVSSDDYDSASMYTVDLKSLTLIKHERLMGFGI